MICDLNSYRNTKLRHPAAKNKKKRKEKKKEKNLTADVGKMHKNAAADDLT